MPGANCDGNQSLVKQKPGMAPGFCVDDRLERSGTAVVTAPEQGLVPRAEPHLQVASARQRVFVRRKSPARRQGPVELEERPDSVPRPGSEPAAEPMSRCRP